MRSHNFFQKGKTEHVILKPLFLQVNQDNLFTYCGLQYTVLGFYWNSK